MSPGKAEKQMENTILGRWKEEAYVLMRVMMGFMILCH